MSVALEKIYYIAMRKYKMKLIAGKDGLGSNVSWMDWNNDGQIGMDDLILTEIILEDDEDEQKNKGGNKPNGSCLSTLLLMVIPPALILITILN